MPHAGLRDAHPHLVKPNIDFAVIEGTASLAIKEQIYLGLTTISIGM